MNEIKYISGFEVIKGNYNARVGRGKVNLADWNGSQSISGTLSLTTNAEQIPKADLGSVGLVYFENLGTNEIEIQESVPGLGKLKIKPGEAFGPIRLGSGFQTPYAKSLVDTSVLSYMMIED